MTDIEIYTKEWCPYCAKAKALLRTKGLAYRELDVGGDLAREQEMIERSGMRTVPQVFINGESIGGYDALAGLNASGELDRRLGLAVRELTTIYDVAVIGAGPAGLVASLYAARKNLSTVLVALDVGGQVGTTHEVANYPGLGVVKGPDLIERLYEQVREYRIDQLIGERVTAISVDQRIRILKTASGRDVCGRCVIIATGAQKRHLNIPGEKELTGKGVVYCSTCDGPLFRGLDIAIVGGGNSGLEAAIEMDGVARRVTLISRDDWTGDHVLQDKVSMSATEVLKYHEPVDIRGSDKVTGLVVKSTKTGTSRTLPVDGVFIEVGLYPNTDLALDLLDCNERGEIKVDAHGQTGVPGIFAAGDAIDTHDKQIIMAAGQGARAALGAFEYLVKQV
ncbi:MAG: glutaredoxin 3 [Thermoleophilia bacterium]|nr:glutaredoxin 3 [Thermoleophilia bacterium]